LSDEALMEAATEPRRRRWAFSSTGKLIKCQR
jgi:hypothetical protein